MKQQTLFSETIYALSSGSLPSGVAVIRLSGPHVRSAVAALTGVVPPHRQATLRPIRDSQGALLDRALVLFFDGPNSFTGEDSAELHLHGGRAVVDAVLSAIADHDGLRLAEAGEFTRRAFLHGKMDLTGAEALADLIAAETEAQRRLALTNAEGAQHQLYGGWREKLVRSRALIEAELDFSDEADIPGAVSDTVWNAVAELLGEIERHLDGYRYGEIIREGFRVVLLGAPNAGKSSLLNALAKRDVAIVTAIPGTTRDLIEIALDLEGLKVVLTDTAGLRESHDVVERIGIDRALAAATRSDLVLLLSDGTAEEEFAPLPAGVERIAVRTKLDLSDTGAASYEMAVSSVTGQGLDNLVAEIARRARAATGGGASIVPSRRRHLDLLLQASGHVRNALDDAPLELRAEELRLASAALGGIIGVVGVEDLLDVIFSEFCVGK
jgi:tRNA modification GTPase